MKQYKVKVNGVTPYMQHRMDDVKLEAWVKQRGPIYERYDISNPDVLADYHSHTFYQLSGLSNVVAGLFTVSPEGIEIPKWDVIDKRSAVNRNIKGRVIVIRPKWTTWEVGFTLTVDEDSITDEMVLKILTNAGKYIGIGSYRPQNKGQFGRFEVIELTKI